MDENELFMSMYDEFSGKIYRFIHYKTCHRETAEDITSLTFLKAMEKWHLYNREKGSISAWLYGIARNLIHDHFRKKAKWGFIRDINEVWDLPSSDNLLKEIMEKESIGELHKILNNLKPDIREIIMLRLWDEMPYKEVAAALGKSEASCKMSFSRAMEKIKMSTNGIILIQILIRGIIFSGGIKNDQQN